MNVAASPSYSGDITINGATIAQHGEYTYTLTGTVDGKTCTTTFKVFIKDPCSTSTFELSPIPLSDMGITVFYGTTETQTQPVKIWTDVER